MVKGNEILSYKGDAALGLASDPGAIGIVGDSNADLINKTFSDAMLLNHQRQLTIFGQKIKDRDNTYAALADGSLNIQDVLEEDRPMIEKKKKEIEDFLYANNGDVTSDPKKFLEFKSKMNDVKDHIHQGQMRYIGVNQLKAERAKNNRPDIIKGYDDQINKTLKQPFFAAVDPYQSKMTWDPKEVQFGVASTTTTTRKGLDDVTTTTLDPIATFKNYTQKFVNPNFNPQFVDFANDFLGATDAPKAIDLANSRLASINAKLGLNANTPGFVDGIKTTTDKNGKLILAESPASFAAKLAMADAQAKQEKLDFDAQRATHQLGEQKLAHDIADDKQKNAIAWFNAKTARDAEDFKKKQAEAKGTKPASVVDEAAAYANLVIKKVGDATDENGVVDITKANLTPQDWQMLGLGTLDDKGKFSLTGLDPADIDGLKFDKATGNIKLVKTTKGGWFSKDKTEEQAIDFSQIANNKLNFSSSVTTGTEGLERNTLIPGYKNTPTPDAKGYLETKVINGVKWGRKADGTIEKVTE